MLNKICDLLEKTGNIRRSSYLWNAINAMLSALQSPVILMVMTRTNGVYDAGVFSIAFAVASLMLYVGLYGLRRFQASNIHEKYSFQEYQAMRFVTCGAMIVASGAYCVYGIGFKGYGPEKAAVVFLMCMLKLVQAYTDVIHGNMQQKDRLDVATKCSSIRYVLEVLGLIAALAVTHNLLLSSIVCVAVSVIGMMLTTVNAGRRYCTSYRPSISRGKFRTLLIDGFPIFISLFLNMYISNAPKYAIDAYLTEEIQAVYNIIFMPAFMVMLIANFIFNPILTSYAELWLSGTREAFRELNRRIRQQLLLVLGLTVLGLAVAWTIGIPILSWIFGVDLHAYRTELCIVMIGGGALAYATFFSTVVTIIREQNFLLVCYGIAALAAFVLSGILVRNHGILGAATLYAVIMTILAVLLAVLTFKKLSDARRNLQNA